MAYKSHRQAAADSLEGQQQALKDASKFIDWPQTVAKYTDQEDQGLAELTFQQILTSRAASDWRQFDVISAASLARACTDCFKLEQIIDDQGWVIEKVGSKGQPVQAKNPHADALVIAQGQRQRLATQLALQGNPDRAENVRNRANAASNLKGSGAHMIFHDEDSLLA